MEAKGKGVLETFWILPKAESRSAGTTSSIDPFPLEVDTKQERLIDWMCQLLMEHIHRVVARRRALDLKDTQNGADLVYQPAAGTTCLDEVKKFIVLPNYDKKIAQLEEKLASEEIVVGNNVATQLRDFVATIASIYKQNPFHNFEHASHVTMAYVNFSPIFPFWYDVIH